MLDLKIIHILVTVFLLISYFQLKNKIKDLESKTNVIENMVVTTGNTLTSSNVDYEAIKNLGTIARGLTKGGFTVPGNLRIDGKLEVYNQIETKNLKTKSILTNITETDIIKTERLVPRNGDYKKNFFALVNKGDGAYLLPPCNNCGGIGKPGHAIDDLYVDGHVSYG